MGKSEDPHSHEGERTHNFPVALDILYFPRTKDGTSDTDMSRPVVRQSLIYGAIGIRLWFHDIILAYERD